MTSIDKYSMDQLKAAVFCVFTEVEEKKVVVRQQVDTGKLVVSGNLLKLLSKTSLRIPVPRPATSKGPINDSAAGN